MKIILGRNPNETFRVIAEDGTDITKHLDVKSIKITADADFPTTIVLNCYGECEVEGDTTLIVSADPV